MELSKKKFWIIIAAVFLGGGMLGASGEESQPSIQPEAVEVVQDVENDSFDRLRVLDDEIFSEASTVIDAQARGLVLAGGIVGQIPNVSIDQLDAATTEIHQLTREVEAANVRVERLLQERQELVSQ